MCIRLETARLLLRPFSGADAEAASRNSKQPVVAHFLSDMILETAEKARGWIAWIQTKLNMEKPFMVLAVELKSNEEVIGLVGVAPKEEIGGETEILFAIADEHQNKGYAAEAGQAMMNWFFDGIGKDSLSAIVKPENKPSRRVIEKLGFAYCDTRILAYDGEPCVFAYFKCQRVK